MAIEKVNFDDQDLKDLPKYFVAFSDSIMAILKTMPDANDLVSKKMKPLFDSAVSGILNEAGDSLIKENSVISRSFRQCDLLDDEKNILFKTFLNWDKKINSWVLYVEMKTEVFWENKFGKIIGKED